MVENELLLRNLFLTVLCPLNFDPLRSAGAAERDEHQAGGDPEVSGHVPGDQAPDLPAILLPVQRRPPGDPGSVQEPGGSAAAPQEVLRQHQVTQDEQGQCSQNPQTTKF